MDRSRCKQLYLGALALLLGVALVPLPVSAQDVSVGIDAPMTIWRYIQTTPGIITVWKVSLSLVDFVVVGGLLVAAFANIFRFQIKTYELKQILPGLIIGIILANLSFFIMRLFIEMATISIQVLGIVVDGYVPGAAISDLNAIHFIFRELWLELKDSLFNLPNPFKSELGLFSNGVGLGTGVFLISVSGTIGASLILIFLVLLAMALPIILFVVLLFLLYLRTYIIALLFMLSPLAFFALGFPPLKNLWQKWWGTFWKWLLMAPAAMAVLAFDLIFLSQVNEGVDFGRRPVVTYFLVNGIGFSLLFLANRIPTMWGQFFGFNAMQQWNKFGKTLSSKGYGLAKRGEDAARTGFVSLAHKSNMDRFNKIRNWDSAGADRLGKIAGVDRKKFMKADGTIDVDRYKVAVQAGLYKKRITDTKNSKNRNLLRMPESTYQGIKKHMSLSEEVEKKLVESHEMYGGDMNFLGRKNLMHGPKSVQVDKLFSKQEAIAKGMDDINDVHASMFGQIEKSERKPMEMAELLQEYLTKSDADKKAAATDDRFGKLDTEARYQLIHQYDRLGRLLNQSANRDARDRLRAKIVADPNEPEKDLNQISSYKAVHYWLRTSKSGGSLPHAATGGSGGGTGADTPVPTQDEIRKSIAAIAAGKGTREDRENIRSMPNLAKGEAESVVAEFQTELEKQLSSAGVAKGTMKNIVSAIYKNIQADILGLDAKTLQGMTPEQIREVIPHIQGYSGSIKGYNTVLDHAAEVDNISKMGAEANIALQGLARLNVKLDVDDLRSQVDGALEALQRENLTGDELNDIKLSLGRIVPHLNFDKSKAGEDLRRELESRAKDIRGMVSILNNEDVKRAYENYNPSDPTSVGELQKTIKVATRVEEVKKSVLQTAAQAVDKQMGQLLQQPDLKTAVLTAPEIVQKVQVPIKTLLEYHPEVQEEFKGLDDEAKNEKVRALTERVLGKVAENMNREESRPASGYYQDNQFDLHDQLVSMLREGFSSKG